MTAADDRIEHRRAERRLRKPALWTWSSRPKCAFVGRFWLLYPLVVAAVHEGDLGRNRLGGSIDPLLELVAACCLGDVATGPHPPISTAPDCEERAYHDLAD